MAAREEVRVLEGMLAKVKERYPELWAHAVRDFTRTREVDWNDSSVSQFFMGWLVYDYVFPGGKPFLGLAKEGVSLDGREEDMVRRLEGGVVGFFDVLGREQGVVRVRDVLTRETYAVATIDLASWESKVIRARLVKNYDEERFFFGGIEAWDEEDVEEVRELAGED